MSSPLNSASFSNLMAPGIRQAFFNSYDETVKKESMVPRLYRMLGSTRQNEYTLSVSAMGDFENFDTTGQITYDDIEEGYKATFTHTAYTKGLKITRKAKQNDFYGIFDDLPAQRGIAAARTREKHGASIFNSAFSGTSGPDSLSLCNSSHTTPVSGVAVQSNTGTDTLSKTTVSSARLAMKKFYGLNGERIGVKADMLLVNMDKEQDAWEIISSKGEPETDNNNRNFHYGKYKLVVWDEIVSQYNWFLIDSRLMKLNLLWFDRNKLELNQDTAFNNYEARFSAYMEYSYGWRDYIWVYGNNATS
jgi:phage major head subunit gpT-like protein